MSFQRPPPSLSGDLGGAVLGDVHIQRNDCKIFVAEEEKGKSPSAMETSFRCENFINANMKARDGLTPDNTTRKLLRSQSQNQTGNNRKNLTKARRNSEQRGPKKNTLGNYFPTLTKEVRIGDTVQTLLPPGSAKQRM